MPRLHDAIGSMSVSDNEATALLAMLNQVGATTNDRRLKGVARRLSLRCQTVIDETSAAEQGISLAEYRCPGHEWAYSGTAYGGDDERYHGEGRSYCVHCGADGDA